MHYRLSSNSTHINLTAILAEVTNVTGVLVVSSEARWDYGPQSEELLRPILSNMFRQLCRKYFSFVVPIGGPYESPEALIAFQAVLKNSMYTIYKREIKVLNSQEHKLNHTQIN